MSETQRYATHQPDGDHGAGPGGAAVRRAVMASALDVVAEDGLNALNMREVARRSGVPNSAPIRLFRDRDGLVAAVAEEGFLMLFATIDGAVATVPADDPAKRIAATAIAWATFAQDHAAQYRVMAASAPLARTKSASLMRASLLVFGRLVRFIEQGQEVGRIRQWPAQEQAVVIWSALHGMAMLVIDGQLDAIGIQTSDSQSLGTLIADRILQGLAT